MAFALFGMVMQTPENLSIFDPVSPSGDLIRLLFYLVLVITGGIFVLVEAVLVYSLLRFRVKKGEPIGKEPPQVYGSTPIEIAWTAAPAIIVFLLILILIRTELQVRVDPDKPWDDAKPLRVTVIGHQWWWEFIYDEYDGKKLGFVTANELHMPASDGVAKKEDKPNRPVFLTLLSADVCHSFWVPRLAGKTDLIPGKSNKMWLGTHNTGTFLGQCAEYCGTQHANMLLRVVVDSPEDFERWLDAEQKPAKDDPKLAAGRELFLAQSCINCHLVRGTRAKGKFGPDLTHLGARKTLASGMVPNTREELRKWVVDPQKTKPGCLMPAFGLSDRDVDLVVDYLRSLD